MRSCTGESGVGVASRICSFVDMQDGTAGAWEGHNVAILMLYGIRSYGVALGIFEVRFCLLCHNKVIACSSTGPSAWLTCDQS